MKYIFIVMIIRMACAPAVAQNEPVFEVYRQPLVNIGLYKTASQLDSLLFRYKGPVLLIDQFLYVPSEECYLKRHFRGTAESRNAGGDSDKREMGGIASNREKSGGFSTQRTTDGNLTKRISGGGVSDRDVAGGQAGRSGGGEMSERQRNGRSTDRKESGGESVRNESGDDSERNKAGGRATRSSDGGKSERTTGGEKTDRLVDGKNQQRQKGGSSRVKKGEVPVAIDTTVYCSKSLNTNTFILKNTKPNSSIKVYDVMGLRSVNGLTVEYY